MKPNPPKKHTYQPKSILRGITIYVMGGNMRKEEADEMIIQEIWTTLIREGRKRTPITYFEIMAFQEYLKRTCPSTIFTVYLIGRLVQEGIEHIEKQETEVFEMSKLLGL